MTSAHLKAIDEKIISIRTPAWGVTMAGGTYFRYYPTVKTAAWTPMTVSFMLVYLALVLTPVILDRKEDRQWKSLQSTI